MNQNQRYYKHLFAASALTASLSLASSVQAALPNGVAAGDTTADSVVLWAWTTSVGPLRFDISESANFSNSRSILTGAADAQAPVKVAAGGLNPATRYYYRAKDFSGQSATGQFRTLALEEGNQGLKFGISGDIRPELMPLPGLRNAAGAALDFFVCLGDCIYAENYSLPDVPTAHTLVQYRSKYRTTLANRAGLNTLKALRASASTYAIIDDHEAVNDFAGGAAPSTDTRFDQNGKYINETFRFWSGIQAFQDYMPIADESYGNTGNDRDAFKRKLYRARRFGKDAAMFMVDTRSFRDAPAPSVSNLSDPAQIGNFMAVAYNPARTLLGKAQLAELKADLKAADDAGVAWKFVLVPEPIQNLGIVGAPDRFEGYAAERTELLKFIKDNAIKNVVFVTADIHGTLVNNLSYEEVPFGPKTAVDAFEISTGPIAFDQPFGPTVVELAAGLGVLSSDQLAFYKSLPVANDADSALNDKDDFIKGLLNSQVSAFGYDTLGLAGSSVTATLLEGDYLATHTYGWTQFEIDGFSKKLMVTTYGIPAYDAAGLKTDLWKIAARQPSVVSRFEVTPKN